MHGVIHHIELYVSNLKNSTKFWQWLLTEKFLYQVYQQWSDGISFTYQNSYIVLVQTEKKFLQPAYHRKRVGLNHLAFHAESREFVDEMITELKMRNIPLLYPDKYPEPKSDYYAIFFEDPDRLKVEIVAP
jgi:catechol 2,3-dioxygenase-like lactoylglutathione lyase family enzyme